MPSCGAQMHFSPIWSIEATRALKRGAAWVLERSGGHSPPDAFLPPTNPAGLRAQPGKVREIGRRQAASYGGARAVRDTNAGRTGSPREPIWVRTGNRLGGRISGTGLSGHACRREAMEPAAGIVLKEEL